MYFLAPDSVEKGSKLVILLIVKNLEDFGSGSIFLVWLGGACCCER